MKGVRDYYDKTAREWAEQGYSGDAELPCLMEFLRRLAPNSRVLDLCCGCGYDCARIMAFGHRAVGIDFSEASLAIARERNPGAVFYNDSILNDYAYIGAVDAIICIAGLVHVETAELCTAFRRMRDVLKDGGSAFLTIRDGVGRLPEWSDRVIDGETYDRCFIAHTLKELTAASEGLFAFDREVGADGTVWRNFIFHKV